MLVTSWISELLSLGVTRTTKRTANHHHIMTSVRSTHTHTHIRYVISNATTTAESAPGKPASRLLLHRYDITSCDATPQPQGLSAAVTVVLLWSFAMFSLEVLPRQKVCWWRHGYVLGSLKRDVTIWNEVEPAHLSTNRGLNTLNTSAKPCSL